MKTIVAVMGMLGVGSAWAAVTNECYVAAGETKSVSDFGHSFAKGDWLKKTGPGRLNADYGTKIIKGGNGESANPMTLRNVTGPVEISADEKVKLAGTFTARGTDLVAGHHLTSATALTVRRSA